MAKLKILTWPESPSLKDASVEIARRPDGSLFQSTIDLAKDMVETMLDAEGVGLAAPQVGYNGRLIVVDAGLCRDGRSNPIVMINPEIVSESGKNAIEEGCLSVPGVALSVSRSKEILVNYTDIAGFETSIAASGLLAICIQHEIDHLDGKLFIDYV